MICRVCILPGWAFPPAPLESIVRGIGGATVVERADCADLLLGWSLGGIRALLDPVPIPRALISSTARFVTDPPHWPGVSAARLRVMRRQFSRDPEAALRGFHALCSSPSTPIGEIARRTRMSQTLDFTAMADGLADLEMLDARAQLAHLHVPILILHGARDRVIPVEAARATAERLPHCRLHIHPEAEHDLPLADPFWVAKLVREFIASIYV